MKPPPFRYHDPRTVSDAIGLLARCENAKLLAGGQSLMPMLNMHYVLPDDVIDLNRIAELSYTRVENEALAVGAMTRQRELEFSDVVAAHFPILREAILNVGHRQTRNRGTVGGSLCHLDPSAEIPTVALALDATLTVAGPSGKRDIAMADFAAGYMTLAIDAGEILIAVRFSAWAPGHGYGFVEFARRHGDFALGSAAALLEEDANGTITRASLTIGGVAVVPTRMFYVEQALIGQRASDDVFRAACEECRKLEAITDVHAPAEYRQHLAAVLSRRALLLAHSRIGRQV